MAKKNEFVITVGFNRDDADHVKAVEILGRMGRTKARYIAKAVLAYEGMGNRPHGIGSDCGGADGRMDYAKIQEIVGALIEQYMAGKGEVRGSKKDGFSEPHVAIEPLVGENDRNDIMASLKAFRDGI